MSDESRVNIGSVKGEAVKGGPEGGGATEAGPEERTSHGVGVPRPDAPLPFGLDRASLAAHLFRRVPARGLAAHDRDTLLSAAAACLAARVPGRGGAPSDFVSYGDGAVTVVGDPGSGVLATCLRDGPFIVSSVRECARAFGRDLAVLLHPILRLPAGPAGEAGAPGGRLSLTVMTAPDLRGEAFGLFARAVASTLRDVLLVPDEFDPLVRTARAVGVRIASETPGPGGSADEHSEVAQFLDWLADGAFLFLGYRLSAPCPAEGKRPHSPVVAPALGICRAPGHLAASVAAELDADAGSLRTIVGVSKLGAESPVHRRVRMSHVAVLERGAGATADTVHSFVGIFTSRAVSEESASIPLVRRRLRAVLDAEDVLDNSYDHKYIVDTIDRMPRDIPLRLDTASLRAMVSTAIDIHDSDYTRVAVQEDPSGRGAFVLVVVPKERFDSEVRERVQAHVESVFGASPGSAEYHLDFGLDPRVRLYFYVPRSSGEELPAVEIAALEADVARLSRSWQDELEERLLGSGPASDPDGPAVRFAGAFCPEYRAAHTVREAEEDVREMVGLTPEDRLSVRVTTVKEQSGVHTEVVIYSAADEVTVSRSLPVMENCGLEVRSTSSFMVSPASGDPVYVHRLRVAPKSVKGVPAGVFAGTFAPGVRDVLLGRAENDALNLLLLAGPLDVRAVAVLRAYSCLLWQVNKFATRGAIFDALASHPRAALLLHDIFVGLFDPSRGAGPAERTAAAEAGFERFADLLRDVKEITKDRILRSLASLLRHTVRTNAFTGRPVLAFKLRSEKIDVMPAPRPAFEIFVRSPAFEGVHLRAGPVARGGLRWSERTEDYRAEILGLMKTQTVKNVLIVPGGAKGGFALRSLPSDPGEARRAVEACYREFIRALLSVTDNRVDGEVRHPERCVIYDGPDPYLVVAADKGTATFSDVANDIATREFDFWLGDAFASGGSKGYDHKLYGITAKGAWECVKRHFSDSGVNHAKDPFTVVGIGDMSGDVFGNGMLLSDKIKLVGAFNHRHVFVDPDPDPARSFAERLRLFEAPGSQWSDYDPAVLSPGGGVYGRFDKEIRLTPEVRAALAVAEDTPESVTGEELISLVLRARVDLLWNGGIGTYVKSTAETHADVNDGTNDRVRVDARAVRARVVGEGGNLGFTQKARIEYSLAGGLINTDAIDNSGGVDMSDHEVNLKVLFRGLIDSGAVTEAERDSLMRGMGAEVTEAVLDHNRSHAASLSVATERSKKSVSYFKGLLRHMAKLGYVNRSLDFLPDDEGLTERADRKGGLARPELAICLAAVKMWVKDLLLASPMIGDPELREHLFDYFPAVVRERFPDAVLAHPLARNIIATQITNTLVDSVGITFVHRTATSHGVTPLTVIKCALAAEKILGAGRVRRGFRRFDNPADNATFLTMRRELSAAVRDVCAWLVGTHGLSLDLAGMVARYREPFAALLPDTRSVLGSDAGALVAARRESFVRQGFSGASSDLLAVVPVVNELFEILSVSGDLGTPASVVAEVVAGIVRELGVESLLKTATEIETTGKWDHQVTAASLEECRKTVSHLTRRFVSKGLVSPDDVRGGVRGAEGFDGYVTTLEDFRSGPPSVTGLAVVTRQLAALAE